jgi:hypothetical protein
MFQQRELRVLLPPPFHASSYHHAPEQPIAAPSPSCHTHLPAERGPASLSRKSALRPESAFVWLAFFPTPREPLVRAGACSVTASERNHQCWVARATLPSSLSLLPPTLSCSLPPSSLQSCSLPSAICHRLSGDPLIPAHTHTWTRICINCEILPSDRVSTPPS